MRTACKFSLNRAATRTISLPPSRVLRRNKTKHQDDFSSKVDDAGFSGRN